MAKTRQPMETAGRLEKKQILEVTVDGKKSNLEAKITFNQDKGTGDITLKLTTKHLSFDPTEKEYILQQLLILAGASHDRLTGFIKARLDAESPEAHGQGNMFAQQEEEAKKKATRTRKKNTEEDVKEVSVAATSSTDG